MRRVVPRRKGQPAVSARGEPDGMTSPAAPARNAEVGEGAGRLLHIPGDPPTPTSRPRLWPRQGARHSDASPPPRSFPSFPRAGRGADGPLLAPSSRDGFTARSPPSAGNRTKPQNLQRPRAAPAASALSLPRHRPSPREPWRVQGPSRRLHPPRARGPAGCYLLSASRGDRGAEGPTRRRWRRQRVPARCPGESLGRSAPPWPRAPRTGSRGGGGVWARCLLPPRPSCLRAGPGPLPGTDLAPRAVANAGPGAAGAPGQPLAGRPGHGGGGMCGLPWRGDSGHRQPPSPTGLRVASGRPDPVTSPPGRSSPS